MNQNNFSIGRPAHRRHAHRGFKKAVGMLLFVTGLFWFAHKAGWIPAAAGGAGLFWPAAVAALGALVLLGSRRRRIPHSSD